MDTVIYQQDGATLHCSDALLEYLHNYFPGDRLVSCCMDHSWPGHSQDHYPLLGNLEDRV